MKSPLFSLLFAISAFGFALPLTGCGDDTPTVASRGGGAPKSKTTTKKVEKAEGVDQSMLPEKLRDIDWSADPDEPRSQVGRDPFLPYVSDLLAAINHDETADTPEEVVIPKGRLVNFDVEELQLIAIITGTAVNKAMLIDPSGLGHMVRAGEIIGRVPMRVERVTRNEILFRPLQPGSTPTENAEIRKTLLTQEELEEQLP